MEFWKNIIEKIKNNEDFSELKESSLRDLMTGNFLNKRFIRKNYLLLVLISVFVFIYIDNRLVLEKNMAKEANLRKELQDVKYQALTISSEFTKLSRRSFILDQIRQKGLNLIESPTPPIVIEKPNKQKDEKTIRKLEEHMKATEKLNKDSSNNDEIIEIE